MSLRAGAKWSTTVAPCLKTDPSETESITAGQPHHFHSQTTLFLLLLAILGRAAFCIIFLCERNSTTTLATVCSFLLEIVFHVLQIMQLSPHSLDIGPSFRGRLMEVTSALARCMKRESVTRFQRVPSIGKKCYLWPAICHICIICRQHVQDYYWTCFTIFSVSRRSIT